MLQKSAPASTPPQLLLIEDDPTLQLATTSALKRMGFAVHAFESLSSALQTLSERQTSPVGTLPLAVVLMDLGTPDHLPVRELMGQLLAFLALHQPHTKARIGLVSGSLDLEKIAQIHGADFFLEKPFLPAELREKLQEITTTTP